MVCLLSLGPSRLVALMAADRVNAAPDGARCGAARQWDGLIRLDRLVSLAPGGEAAAADQHSRTAQQRELTRLNRTPDT